MRLFAAILSLVIVFASPVSAMTGCFSIVAGKNTTVDGSVLLGHNEDNARKFAAGLWKVEAAGHDDGDVVRLDTGASIAQVSETRGYLWLQMPELDFSDAFLNDRGVAIVTNNCPSREDNPELTEGGIGGAVLRRIVAERASSAREGVEIVGELVETYGYTASGRTMVICDASEGWLVGIVNGKHWVAKRVSDDEIAMIANTYTIRDVDLSDTANYLGSADIVDYAVERGWHDPSEGPFDFERAYASRLARSAPGNTHRQWSGLRHVSAAEVPLPEKAPLPFSVRPKEKVNVAHLTAVLRDHYEGSPYETAVGYEEAPAHERHTSTICHSGTNSSSIFQLRGDMPVEIGSVWWLALWQPCSTPYIPIYLGIDAVPDDLALGGQADDACPFCVVSPRFGNAYQAFADFSAWVDEDYAGRISQAQALWSEKEKSLFLGQIPLEIIVRKFWDSDREKARAGLAVHTRSHVEQAIMEAREMMGVSGSSE